MASYDVDILLKISKQEDLKKLQANLKAAEKAAKDLDKNLRALNKFDVAGATKRVNIEQKLIDLAKQRIQLQKQFNEQTAEGNRKARQAAADFFRRQRQYRQALSKPQYSGPIGPGPASPLPESSPVTLSSPLRGRLDRQLKDAAALQEHLGRMEQRSLDIERKTLQVQKRQKKELTDILDTKVKTVQANKKAAEQTEKAAMQARKDKLGAAVSAGAFPLLFGGGPGMALGGALGGALTGATFGPAAIALQVLGGAVDQLVVKIADIGTALNTLDVDRLRNAGIRINSELKQQVESLREANRIVEARAILEQQVFEQTGALPGVTQDISNAFNYLVAASKEFAATVGATLGILGAPFMAALGAIINAVNVVLKGINLLFSVVGKAIKVLGAQLLGLSDEEVAAIEKGLANINGQLDEMNDKDLSKLKQGLQGLQAAVEENNLLKLLVVEETTLDKIQNIRVKAGKEMVANLRKTKEQLGVLTEQGRVNAANLLNDSVMLKANREIQKLLNKDKQDEARETTKITDERERQVTQALTLEQQFSRELKKREAATQLEKDKNRIAGEFEERMRRIEKIGDKELTKEATRLANQIKITDEAQAEADARFRSLQAANDLADSQAGFEMQLATVQANAPGMFAGPFGGSEKTAFLGQKKIELELQEREREIGEAITQGLTERATQLKASRDQYKAYETQILEATVAQEQFTEALAITQPVTDSLFDSLMAVAEGTKSAEEAFADFLRSIASMLMDAAKQMIATYIAIGVAKMFAGMGGGVTENAGSSMKVITEKYGDFGAQGAANAAATLPPVPKMALGGAVGAGQPYLVGEKGPELFVPGAQGNIVPNNAMGGSNIVVNVDASGSSVEGDAQQSKALGQAIGAAVQAEIIKQKMPGGLLN